MNCVLLGYGTVGRSVESLASLQPDLQMKGVFVRPSKADEPYFTSDGTRLVTDPSVDLVFECLNGLEPANTLIRSALAQGKHVISSNKAVLSAFLPEYLAIAKVSGGTLGIEASVGGGIPLIDGLLKLSAAEDLTGFSGILNGTSNYILSSMESEGTAFDDALAAAQKKGYAEANPAADVEGIDVWYKTLLTSSLITKSPVTSLPRPLGISRITDQDISFATRHHRKIRHLAHIRHEKGRFAALIAPFFLENTHYLASVSQNYNAQLIEAPSFGSLGYYGPGAGGSPTAQAMIADAIDAVSDRIRPITLDRSAVFDDSLIETDWVVRSQADLSALTGADAGAFEEENYWKISQRTPEVIEQVLAIDPEAMIGVWNQA